MKKRSASKLLLLLLLCFFARPPHYFDGISERFTLGTTKDVMTTKTFHPDFPSTWRSGDIDRISIAPTLLLNSNNNNGL